MTPRNKLKAAKLCKEAKKSVDTLIGGDDVSRTAEELVDHVEETHEVVGEAVEKLVESAGKLIDETIGTDGLGAAAKLAVEGAENVVLSPVLDVSRAIAEHVSEPAHTVARNVLEATGGTAEGVSCVKASFDMSELAASAEHVAGDTVENVADNVAQLIDATMGTDGAGAAANVVVEGVEDVAVELVESTVEVVADEVASELIDAALDAVPVAGQCLSGWRMLRGAATATVGVGALAVSASIAATAYFTANERTKQTASKTAWWGASLTGEGTFLAAKGATSMANIVPGMQFVTFPLSVCLGLASSRCARVRNA